ncbi:amino acid/amide ABC transporter membrane protein 1 (HAAT family) [Lachnotalea glycerini]|uniref:Amino acid/amide ABC transporter membrane protein 1 (HAAT family) n=1 Tax=Lachnotalea glycerini TaxID=1763509 RepID=A0A255IHI9_9FIRM|nr:branched-chain amino acid ABC transporter permease [Lachnotalea glycerini]PXV91621.1 amino acid/amide ABC transporter membrane protein 1 (HAAT family) [Lachnotalea glycerini]RDY28451.1 branched-chain amino acid ABC transporter permease [Lachnotalea glycerini]
MSTFLQAGANGLMVGGIYALIGVSLTLIFGVMKIINFCQGELLMLGMYTSFVLYDQFGLDPFLAIPIVAIFMFIFGALLQFTLITRSLKDEDDDTNVLFLTVGLGILFQNLALLYFKSDYRTASSIFSDKIVSLGVITVSLPKLVSFILLIIVTALMFLLLKYTNIGKQIRATSQNKIGAEVSGIKTKSIYAATYGLGAAIAGITGACLMSFYYVFPSVGEIYGTRSFIVVTMGGLGSVVGALVSGIVLGLMETIGAVVVGSSFKDTIVFLTFICILVVKQRLKTKRG